MLIDSHCHLERFANRGDLNEVLNEASLAGVNRLITVGTSQKDWDLYRNLSAEYERRVFYTVGLHPCEVNEKWEEQVVDLDRRMSLGDDRAPVAIGEIGLDFFHLPKDLEEQERIKALQIEAFKAQLEIANRVKLPIVIHSRNAFDECVKLLDTNKVVWDRVVFHCFSGGKSEIDRINLRGGRGSFTGIITYDQSNTEGVREALSEQGIERLMIETDCPYLTPHPHKGKENKPSFLRYTFQRAASVLQLPVMELEEIVEQNTIQFFGLED